MGGKGEHGTNSSSIVLAGKRVGSLAQRPLAQQEAQRIALGQTMGGFRQKAAEKAIDILGNELAPKEIIADVLRKAGITRDKALAGLIEEAEQLFKEHSDGGVGMSPEAAALCVALRAGTRVRGKPLKASVAEGLDVLYPPYDPQTGGLKYADDTPDYEGLTASERVMKYYLSRGGLKNTLGIDYVPENMQFLQNTVAEVLGFWANHPDCGKMKGGLKPEDAARQLGLLSKEDLESVGGLLEQPEYPGTSENYSGLSAKGRISKRLAESKIVLGSEYHNQLFNEVFRRWTESYETMKKFPPEEVASVLLGELEQEENPDYKDAQVASPEKIKEVLQGVGISDKHYLYPDLARMVFDHWMSRDKEEMAGVPLETFVKEGLAGIPDFLKAKMEEDEVRLAHSYNQYRDEQVAQGLKPEPLEDFIDEVMVGKRQAEVNPEQVNAAKEIPEYENDEPEYKGRTAEERIHKYIENDPGWSEAAPLGSAVRTGLVSETVAYWKTQDTGVLRPERALDAYMKYLRKQFGVHAATVLTKADKQEIMRQAKGEIHGALASEILANGSYYYQLAHEAWRLWLESLRGGWKNNKRRKRRGQQLPPEVLAKIGQDLDARMLAMNIPHYGNDKPGYAGLSAVERAQMRVGQSGLDEEAAGRVLKSALVEWGTNLNMSKSYAPEDAVSRILDTMPEAKPKTIRERKEMVGKS